MFHSDIQEYDAKQVSKVYTLQNKVSSVPYPDRYPQDLAPLIELELIVHICCVLAASLVYFARVVFLDPTLLVPSERIPGEVRVLLIQVVFRLVSLLGTRCLQHVSPKT